MDEVPYYCDQCYKTSLPISEMKESLDNLLKKKNCLYVWSSGRIDGILHVDSKKIYFRINLFRTQENIIVECQRRDGCILTFGKQLKKILE